MRLPVSLRKYSSSGYFFGGAALSIGTLLILLFSVETTENQASALRLQQYAQPQANAVFAESAFGAESAVSAFPAPTFEVGTVTADEAWQTVSLVNTYQSPVVTASYHNTVNPVPASVRVKNVTANGFEVRLQNPSGQDLTAEQISYLVIEEGVWELNGMLLEAHRHTTSTVGSKVGGWRYDTATFGHAYSDSAAPPLVLHQVMTTNDESWISSFVSRNNSFTNPPDTNGLRIALNGAEATGTHGEETIGWVAIEAGKTFEIEHTTALTVSGESTRTPDNVFGADDGCYRSAYRNSYASTPVVIAAQQEMDGGDGGWAVVCSNDVAGVGLYADEDQVRDSERKHTSETMGFVAFTAPFAYPIDISSDTTAPTVPQNLTVSFAWEASTDDIGIAGYNIYRNGVQIDTVEAAQTSYTDQNTEPGTAYAYSVSAVDLAGNESEQTAVLGITMPGQAADTAAPTVPANLTATTTTETSTTLTWDAATDNVGVTAYKLYRDGTELATVDAASGTTYTDSTLTINTTYSYAITAIDAAGNESGQSTPVAVTTFDTTVPLPPALPSSLTPAPTTPA